MSDPAGADRDRPALRAVWRLAYPLLIAGLTQIVLNIVDTVMLARLSTDALSAFALAAPVYLVALIVVRGWATAVQVQVAQRHGAGRPEEVTRVVRVGLITALAAGVAVGALLYAVATPVLTVLGAPQDLIGSGTAYLRVLAWAVPVAAVSFTLQGACAGIGATRVSMYTALLVNAVNLPLGLLLIFRAGLGVTGAAVATLVATAAGTGYLLLYCRTRLLRATGEPAGSTKDITRGLWRIGWPEMSTLGIGYVNEALLAGFAARMGTHELAAYRIVDNLLLVVFTVLASGASAVMVLAGQELGRGDHDRADAWHRAGTRLLLLMLALPSAAALALGRPLIGLVTEDPAVAELAWHATPLALLSMAPMVLAMTRGALLRAAGDTRSVMTASVTSDYTLLIPLGWLLGVHLGLGLPGLYLAWTAFAALYALLLHLRYRRRFRSADGAAAGR
ncbi:MATE family efflux transporter [Streptomyces spinoverrucosus]|uniref:MATE family efflux transporter n=1 Tax=Streptomyces spinoverrucosus TaxID=284043 RepID=UPI0018C42246|nr:MATE family efflux transporter [Streptomyces spinoverrucosus]MBG0857019.1 MATE family efflux transporter [Streptomyces spinoverrucosus]